MLVIYEEVQIWSTAPPLHSPLGTKPQAVHLRDCCLLSSCVTARLNLVSNKMHQADETKTQQPLNVAHTLPCCDDRSFVQVMCGAGLA